MATTSTRLDEIERLRDSLRGAFADIGDMRQGSLFSYHGKCGKAGCHCTSKDSPGHGPYWRLTREVEGKTITRNIPDGPCLEQTRVQIQEYQRFRELVQRFTEVSVQLCEGKLQAPQAASEGAAKKGASERNLKRRSRTKSKTS